jgi:hypothetical protein
VAYRIVSDPRAAAQVVALPVEALELYGQVLDVLQLQPWNASDLWATGRG